MNPQASDQINRYVDAIKGNDWDARNHAELELISLGSAAVPRMVDLLRDESWIARMVASRVIAQIGADASAARNSIEEMLETEEDHWVRRNAEWALREIGSHQ